MKKKWLISVAFALALALVSMPLSGLSSHAQSNAKVLPNQVDLVSGGFFPGGVAEDGIIFGGYCVPDLHDFQQGVDTVVLIAGLHSDTLSNNILTDNVTVYAEIYSGGHKIMEVPMYTEGEETVDYRNGNPLYVGAIRLGAGDYLPTGEYNYMFKAKAAGENGHVLDVWVPRNHKFTVVDYPVGPGPVLE